MNELITPRTKGCLCKDEALGSFLLFRRGEIYRFDEDHYMVLSWWSDLLDGRKKAIETDDGLYGWLITSREARTLIGDLDFPHYYRSGSNFLRKASERLGHKIIPFHRNTRRQKLSTKMCGILRFQELNSHDLACPG